MTWLLFTAAALVVLAAGVRLAKYGDIIGAKSGMGGSWIGLVLVAATTSLPELITGFGSTATAQLPDIAVGDVLGSCMFNLLILSVMDAIQPEPLSARAHQGHTLAIGFGLLLVGIAGFGLVGGRSIPAIGWIGIYTPALIVVYLVAMRLLFQQQRQLVAAAPAEASPVHAEVSLAGAAKHYAVAAAAVVFAAIWLPRLGARLAHETGLGEALVGSLLVAATTSLPELVVSLSAVRLGALDLGVGNVLGSNLFNLLILGLDDVFYRPGPLLAAAEPSHAVTVVAVIVMNALFLIGLTYKVLRKRFVVSWDTGAIAAVYVLAAVAVYALRQGAGGGG